MVGGKRFKKIQQKTQKLSSEKKGITRDEVPFADLCKKLF
ncbi:hypothetical protein X929_06850 [Petrotoga olearia DSM 13574]|uniref:Uncharacterized protein n=1 Tax=Petrotoga olearia DSM 13574 TaxID=1122955 RepID=A0A2K1NZF1_9BACT|nr:hypothetical protein X929_06850 [Petrotoga olearia DSM 13574]